MMKILQFTDSHLFADQTQQLRGVNTHDSWLAIWQHAQHHHPDADLILLTGDLSQDETLESYQLLRQYLLQWSIPVYWILGNHDVLSNMQPVLNVDNIKSDKTIINDDWQIILLDSQWPNHTAGQLTVQQLDFLQQQLLEYSQPALIALHHHVLPVGNHMDDIKLENANELLAILQASPQVKAVVSGHVHQQWQGQHNNIDFYTTPSTCYQLTPGSDSAIVDMIPPGYRWFELTDDARIFTAIERVEY